MTNATPPDPIGQPRPHMPVARARPALLLYWSALAVGTHWPRLALPELGPGQIRLDTLVHFAAFGVLAWLLHHASPRGRHARFGANLGVALLLAAVYAVIDEFTQTWFERVFDWTDIAANFAGVGCAGTWLGLARWRSAAPRRAAADTDRGAAPSFVGSTVLISVLTLVSRLLGVIRDAVIAALFGMTGLTDAFWVGFIVPNLFRRLFGEGALTAAFVPVYTGLLHRDRAAARRLASACALLLVASLGAITVLGEGVLAAVAAGTWSDRTELALRLIMVMLPYMPLICLTALLSAVLQVHGRFGSPAAAPTLLNVVVIVGAVLADRALDPAATPSRRLTVVALSVLIAGVLQVLWQLATIRRFESFTGHFGGTGAGLRSIGATMLPMLLGLGVFQVNVLLDTLIAFFFSANEQRTTLHLLGHVVACPMAAGSLSALQYAQRLYQFPLGVFGLALATAIFPALAHAAAVRQDGPDTAASTAARLPPLALSAFRRTLQQGLCLALFIALPASAGLVLVRLPLVRVIFEHGRFGGEDSAKVAAILAGYGGAIWAYCLTHVFTRAFYALRDAHTPLWISVAMVGVNLVLNLTFIWPLGAAGLAWATSLSSACQVVLLAIALGRRVDGLVDRTVRRSWGRSLLLTVAMGAALALGSAGFDAAALSRTATALLLAALVIGGALVYAIAAHLLAAPELKWLLRDRAR